MESSDDTNRGVAAGILLRSDHGRITECLFFFIVGQSSMSQDNRLLAGGV